MGETTIYAPLWSTASICFFAGTNVLLKQVTPISARTNHTQSWKWRNIATSFIHSFLTGVWALLSFYWHPKLAEDLIGTCSVSSVLLVSVSVGYFIHDFFVITCFGLAELTHRYVGYAVVALLVEVNSVFLHLRQLMIIQGVSRQHPIYRLNSLFNIGTFLIFRILTLGWMTRWLVLHRDQVPFFAYTMGSIALAVIVLMNIVLFFRILQVDFLNKKGRSK